tara:strand:+ start:974 stop:2212 length:1239 start_codon:yes stop_codon:yes gene_type:complete
MVLPLIGSILAPALLGSSGLAAGLGTLGLTSVGTGAALAGLGAGLGSLAQGDDLETALGTGLTSGLTAGVAGKLLGGAGAAGGLPEGVSQKALQTTATANLPTGAQGKIAEGIVQKQIAQKLPETLTGTTASDALAKAAEQALPKVGFKEIALATAPTSLTAGLTAQAMQPLEPMDTGRRKINYKPGQAPRDRGTAVGGDIRTGMEADYGFELPKAREGMLKLAEGGGLKALPSADENPGLRKLPESVRNNMGYMQEGGITSMMDTGAMDTGKNDKEIISDAVRAIAGMSATPQDDLAMFVSKFGEDALEDLVDRVRSGQFGANLMADGEGLQRGAGDGMDDMIPANIEGEQDVLLSNDEFVVPADVVSGIGNGSSDAGAKALYDMMDRVRTARTGMTEQPPDVPQEDMLPV